MNISTDASKKGGVQAFCMGQNTGGQKVEAKAHINVLEPKAANLEIQAFVKSTASRPHHIQLLMDNSTAVSYLNKRGHDHRR